MDGSKSLQRTPPPCHASSGDYTIPLRWKASISAALECQILDQSPTLQLLGSAIDVTHAAQFSSAKFCPMLQQIAGEFPLTSGWIQFG